MKTVWQQNKTKQFVIVLYCLFGRESLIGFDHSFVNMLTYNIGDPQHKSMFLKS